MSEIKIPTCGRMVHYFPVLPDVLKANAPTYIKMLPAIVIESIENDLAVNMCVFGMGSGISGAETKWSVQHKSCVAKDEDGNPRWSYWDWPEIK